MDGHYAQMLTLSPVEEGKRNTVVEQSATPETVNWTTEQGTLSQVCMLPV